MFRSKAQQGFMEAAKARGEIKPSVVKEFEDATSKKQYEDLPEHVEKKAEGGYACMHCGGEVDEKGQSMGYDDQDNDEETVQEKDLDEREYNAKFADGVRGKY